MKPKKVTAAAVACRLGAVLSVLMFSSVLAAEQGEAPRIGLLYWVGGNQLSRAHIDGSDFQVLVSDLDEPDGLVADPLNNIVYWTNMSFGGPGGSVQRARLDGSAVVSGEAFLVPPGSFQVGKEIELDKVGGKLYWADRDGRRIMRANTDGSDVQPVLSGFTSPDGKITELQNPVGIALDPVQRQVYMTDRFMGTVMRFGMDLPAGESHRDRSDVEILVQPRSAEDRPIDIDLDLENGQMYWTDRGVHQVLRAQLDGSNLEVLIDPGEVVIKDPIGISLDLASRKIYWSDMSTHNIHRANLDGSRIEHITGGSKLLNGVPYGPLGLQYKAIEPEHGSAVGGDRVAVMGAGFIPGKTRVRVGAGEAIQVEVVSEHLLHFTAPAGKAGRADLMVTTPHGEATLRNGYRYDQR
jgi:hypothetical protein